MKKKVGYSLIAFSVLKAVFIFYERFTGHTVPLVEDASYVFLAFIGISLIFTNIHRSITKITNFVYETIELRGFDAFNYVLADTFVSISQAFRKTHTGILSHNLDALKIGGMIILLMFLVLGGFL